MNYMFYLYNEMEDKNISIEMNYIPKINNNIINNTNINSKMENKIRIFGETFVKNNKGRCKIIRMSFGLLKEYEEYELTEFFNEINEFYDYSTPISFKLKGINNIIDMSKMFSECNLFKTLPDISEWDTSNVINMNGLFNGCTSLSLLPDISKWDTSNVINMRSLFSSCNSLASLPDISKWDTSNVIDMSFFLNACISLQFIPDISKWNTSKVTNMDGFFKQCRSLSFLPDISKWNTKNIENMKDMFWECKAKNIPYKFK